VHAEFVRDRAYTLFLVNAVKRMKGGAAASGNWLGTAEPRIP
jgi:hypothetical protein